MRLEQLMDDPGLAARLGQNARRFALERLSWQRNAVELAGFYEEVIASHRTAVVT